MSQMIPLKIADMAVAACNEEIAKLRFDNAHLKGRVIALEAQLESEKAYISALRKLGTTMATHLPDTDEANRAYIDFEAGGRQ